jgi:hypothetical protein
MDDYPGPIGTSISLPSAIVSVRHHAVTALGSAPSSIILRESKVVPDTLTEIRIQPYRKPNASVLFLWERQSAVEGVGLLVNEATNTLFVGAATFAAAVRLDTSEVVGAHDVCLFWSFQPCGELVLELGELSCYLRSPGGDILGEADVDPPYEIEETPEGVRFESIVMGTQWLRFPGRSGVRG